MRKFNFKSSFILILAALVLVSSLSVSFLNPNSAKAEASGYEQNLLTGLTPSLYGKKIGKERATVNNNYNIQNLNDGNATNEFSLDVKFADYNGGNVLWYDNGVDVYADIEFDLGELSEVKKLVLTNHSREALRTNRFKFYLSETKDDLYDDAKSLVKDYVNTEKAQINEVTLETPRTAKYFAIRIINPITDRNSSYAKVTSSSNQSYTRIFELELFGKKAYAQNLLTGLTPSLYGKKINEERKIVSNTYNIQNLNDGNPANEFTINTVFADYNGGNIIWYDDGTQVYADIEFNLGDVCDVKKLVLTNHSIEALRTGRFKFYLSEVKSELYDDSKSLVKDYTNTDKAQVNTVTLETARKAKYFAIRFIDPVCDKAAATSKITASSNRIYPSLFELELFGERKESNVTVENVGYTQSADVLTELTASNNLLYNREYNKITQFSNGSDTSFTAEYKLSLDKKILTNAVANAEAWLGGAVYYDGNGNPLNDEPYINATNYTTISYFLGGKSEVNEFRIYHHSSKKFVTYAYGIYIADDRSKLFDAESLVCVHENKAAATMQKFTFKESIKGSYMGVKFFIPVPLDSTEEIKNRYVRIAELAAFGTVKESGTEEKDPPSTPSGPVSDLNFEELKAKYGNNMAKGIQPIVNAFDGANYKIQTVNIDKITDENVSTECGCTPYFADWNNGNVQYFDNGTRYSDVSLDFRYEVDISAILVANHKQEQYRTYKYNLYASNDKDTLFDESNIIKKFENTNLDRFNTFELQNTKVRYVGMRVFKASKNHLEISEKSDKNYTRLLELAVFGDWADPDGQRQSVTVINKEFIDKFTPPADKNNIIYKKDNPSFSYSGSIVNKPETYCPEKDIFTDNDLTKHATLAQQPRLLTTDGTNYLDIIYEFDKSYDVTGLLYLGIAVEYQTMHYTGWYEAYVGEERDDLFLPENRVFEYKWESGDPYQMGHVVNFDNYVKKGSYFAIRILSPATTATTGVTPRVAEIAVYGKESVIEIKPTNLASNMPIEAYSVAKDGSVKPVSDKNLTLSEIKNLTDDNKRTSATIKTSDSKVQIIYNLCNDDILQKLAASSNAGGYKIYASSDLNKLKSKESLIYTSKKGSSDGIALSGSKAKKKYRYVMFEFTGIKGSLTINELSVIGGDNQLLKYKKVSRSLEGKNAFLRSYNYEEDKTVYLDVSNSFNKDPLSKLFDGDVKTPNGIFGGQHNEETLELIITFEDVRNIDSITLDFPSMYNFFSPKKAEIYISEEPDALAEGKPTVKPIATFNDFPKKGKYTCSFRPTLARTMLVRFICGDTEYNGYDEYMCYALNEITVYGTAVVGMQPDTLKEELLTFTDKKTGISASVIKIDDNDIFTRVSNIKVTKIKATTAQKKGLAKIGSYKALGDSVYKVQLVDYNGNVVTDLGGRLLKVRFPYNVEKYGYPILANTEDNDVTAADVEYIDNSMQLTTQEHYEGDYMLGVYAPANDPYFDELDVIPPETDIMDNIGDDLGFYPDLEGDTTSPETGEIYGMLPIAMFVFLIALVISVFTFSANKRNKESLEGGKNN